MNFIAEFTAALRFLTRLPLPSAPVDRFGAAAFPVVGLLLGAVAVAADRLTSGLPDALRNVEILVLWAAATGAIHYDGLADVLDALGGQTREERLRIMRDGAVGVFAALGLVFVVVTELGALGALRGEQRSAALLVAPIAGRFAMLVGAFGAPAARDEGLGASFVRDLARLDVAIATLAALVLSLVFAGWPGAISALLAAAAAFAVRRFAVSAFGGVTGDVLGACGKIAETLTLAFFAAT